MRTGWRLIRKHELTYLRGIEHGFARLQRREKRSRDWMEHHQQKIARLRASKSAGCSDPRRRRASEVRRLLRSKG